MQSIMSKLSTQFSPSTWECPHCLQHHHPTNNPITFLRGTCRHDVCTQCITQIIHRRTLVKQRASPRGEKSAKNGRSPSSSSSSSSSLIEVSCPVEKCCRGRFVVDRLRLFSTDTDEVIDLCEEEHTCESNKVKDEPTPSTDRSFSRTKEENPPNGEPDNNNNANIVSPRSAVAVVAKKKQLRQNNNALKPLLDIGDEVVAAWWNPNLDAKRQGKASWYPGRIVSYKTVGTAVTARFYNVKYNDGDELDDLEDYWVFPKEDYELTMKFEKMGRKPIGVRRVFDKGSSDRWMRDVGWYEMTVDGKKRKFSRLTEAMKAHDKCVIRKHGKQTKKSYLNMAENYKYVGLFSVATTTLEPTGVQPSTTSTTKDGSPMVNNDMSKLGMKSEHSADSCTEERNAASPILKNNTSTSKGNDMPGPTIKNEHPGVDDHCKGSNVKEESDDESRFSEVDIETKIDEEEDTGAQWREVKRRRLDLSPEANMQNAEFWSVKQAHIEFTRQAFMTKTMFHLNSFVDGKKKKNQAFALFLREGVASPGFNALPTSIDVDKIAGWSYSQLRDALDSHSEWGSNQTAMWLKNASVGSFIIMRHEYGRCRFCPGRLKDENGKYIGPVYVIGIITKKVVPWSAEERDIADHKMGEFSKHYWDIHNICRVSWRRMGYKNTLKDETQKYINHVCQPTLQRICDNFGKVFAGGATSESIRSDLWDNATVPICSSEFPDKFDHADH